MNGTKYILSVLLLATAGIFQLYSQEKDSLTLKLDLQEAVKYAIEHNYDLMNSDLDVLAARRKIWETTAMGLPQISAAYNYQHIPGSIPMIQFSDSVKFPIAVRNTASYNITLNQLIFSGDYIVGLMASRTYLDLTETTRDKSELDTKESVMSGYYNILVLESNRDILDSSILTLNSTLANTKAMVDAGFQEITDYEQLQVTLNTNINAKNSIENNLQIARIFFKIQLGLKSEDSIFLTDNLDTVLEQLDYNGLLSNEFVLDQNLDYELLKIQEDVEALNLKREKAAFLPTVSAFYTYMDKTNKAVFDFTLNHMIGLNLTLPIFSSGQRIARVKQAQIALEKSENTTAKMSEMLIMNVEQARLQFVNAYEKYEIQKKNIDLSKKIYDRTEIKFREGIASSMELNQANTQYLNNFSLYTTSISELLNAKISYRKALNKL